MKIKNYIFLLIVFLLAYINYVSAQTPSEFKKRRERLTNGLSHQSIVLLRSSPVKLRNGDVNYPYRQSSTFYYFTGIEEPDCFLLLSPGKKLFIDNENKKEILFLPLKNKREEIWQGKGFNLKYIKDNLSFEEVLPLYEYKSLLDNSLSFADTLFLEKYPLSDDELLSTDIRLILKARKRLPSLEIAPITEKINTMREIKSSAEIALIEKAVEITIKAHKAVMKYEKPGMYEYELEGLIDFTYKKNGAKRHGFLPIIGSGTNSCILHYKKNDKKIENGEVIVIDTGAEYKMYTADITRTIPVSGRFSGRQKEIYNIVLKAHNEAVNIIKPGIDEKNIHKKAIEVITDGLLQLGLIENQSEYKRYFMHGTSHPVGLDVHDVSVSSILKPGMVITVEPGIYIREENLGIRIESDVLVTDAGYEVLSEYLPITVEEIEKFMSH